MLAAGYKLSQDALEKAKALDGTYERHFNINTKILGHIHSSKKYLTRIEYIVPLKFLIYFFALYSSHAHRINLNRISRIQRQIGLHC